MKSTITLRAFLNKWLVPNNEELLDEFENDLNRLEIQNTINENEMRNEIKSKKDDLAQIETICDNMEKLIIDY